MVDKSYKDWCNRCCLASVFACYITTSLEVVTGDTLILWGEFFRVYRIVYRVVQLFCKQITQY